jgi:hypothetical protein
MRPFPAITASPPGGGFGGLRRRHCRGSLGWDAAPRPFTGVAIGWPLRHRSQAEVQRTWGSKADRGTRKGSSCSAKPREEFSECPPPVERRFL